MNAVVLCVGKLRERCWREAADEYEKRLTRYGRIEETEIPDLPEPANASQADRERVMREEGAALLRRIRREDEVIALCIDGKACSSEAFASLLSEAERTGRRQVFVIGGSLGLAPEVVRRADRRLSFSPMTFPHQLARVMLLEQIYRACKINAGEKYHK
ncbi:MAG: 23S rRNA (pseudouridine(1915)-N(3))-methyltransferase RlmH [Clostridia bacterium]|nr:23S rRNA (pseudouridine(1915)-N(3))-methyltransferase RlmH [Clostridia bacterium]